MKKLLALFLAAVISFSQLYAGALSLHEEYKAEIVSFALFEGGEKIISSEEQKSAAIGSVSKIFTAVLTLKLCEEGLLSLEGRVTDYLPEFSMNDERYKEIKIEHLLNHTSGLFGSTMKNTILYKTSDSWNHDNFLSLLKNQRLKYAPGEMANYCNDGYTLLELIIEKVSGMSYSEYLGKVFKDLPEGKLITAASADAAHDEIVNSIAAGGIYSDAETLCRALYMINGQEAVLKSESVGMMQRVRDGALEGERFGLGWDDVSAYPFDKYGIKALTKGGDTLYYHSSVIVLPEYGITACVILKGGDSRIAEAEAKNLIIDYLKDKKEIEINYYPYEGKVIGDTENISGLERYEGLYLSGRGQFKFTLGNGYGTVTELLTGKSVPMTYIGGGIFDAGNGILYFREINGEIYMVTEGVTSLGEKESQRFFEYYGVKKNDGGEANPIWHERSGKVYFLCDENYKSILYMQGITALAVNFSSVMPGYLSYMKTVDDKTALSDIAVPGTYGRDLTDIRAFYENGKEYIKSQEWTFVDAESLPFIYSGEKSVCTILPDGYTRWFKSGEAGGKKINAKINGNGMFALYDASGKNIYSSLRDSFEITIPENGYIAFSGEIGTVFEITLA